MKIKKFIKKKILNLFYIYLIVCGVMFVLQREFIYYPHKKIGSVESYGLQDFKEVILEAEDGVKLDSWYKKAEAEKPVIVFFHGNAGNMSNRVHIYDAFTKDNGFGLLALEYRGFGKSEGSPSEKGLYKDGRAALRFLLEKENIDGKNIVIYGESLGTGVATKMAVEFDLRAVVLQAPFTSVWQRAQEIYKILPVKYLVKDRFDSLSRIRKVQEPLLIFHGTKDMVIPIHHGRKLFEEANEPKKLKIYEGRGHSNFDNLLLIKEIEMFLTGSPIGDIAVP